jgi:hypothetical protein
MMGLRKNDNDFNIVEMRWYEDPRFNKGLKWEKEDHETILRRGAGFRESTLSIFDRGTLLVPHGIWK